MGKKSKKKGGATNKAARKEKLQERREQQLEEVDNNQGSTALVPRQYFEGDRVWFYHEEGMRMELGDSHTNTYRGIVKHVQDDSLVIIPFQSKIDRQQDNTPMSISVDDTFPDFCDMTLRFDVGDRVLCYADAGWVPKIVQTLWPISEIKMQQRPIPRAPNDIVPCYKCWVDENDNAVAAPHDADYCIKEHPSSFRFDEGDNVIFNAYRAIGIGRSVSQLKKITDNYPWTWVEGRVKSIDITGMDKYAAYTCSFEVKGTMYSCLIRKDNDEHITKQTTDPRGRLFEAIEQDCSRDHIMYLIGHYDIDIMAFQDLVVSKALEYASYQALSWLQHDCGIDMINLKDEQGNNLLHKIASSEHATRFIREAGRLNNTKQPPDWKLNLTDYDTNLMNSQNNNGDTWLQILVKRGNVKALDTALSPHCGLAWELAHFIGIRDNEFSSLEKSVKESKDVIMQQVFDSFVAFRTPYQQCNTVKHMYGDSEEDLFKRDSMHPLQGTDALLNAKRLTRFFNDWQGYNKSFFDDNPFTNIVGHGFSSLFKLLYDADETMFIHKEYSLSSQEDMNEYIQPELLVDWEDAPYFRDADIWTACTIGNNVFFHSYHAKDHTKRYSYLRSIQEHVLNPEHPSLLSLLHEKANKESSSSLFGGEVELAKYKIILLEDSKTLEGRLMILDYLLQHNPIAKLKLNAIDAIRNRQCGVLRFIVDKGLVKMEAGAASNRIFTKQAPNMKCLEKGRIPSSMTAASFLSFVAVGKSTYLYLQLNEHIICTMLISYMYTCSYHMYTHSYHMHLPHSSSIHRIRRSPDTSMAL